MSRKKASGVVLRTRYQVYDLPPCWDPLPRWLRVTAWQLFQDTSNKLLCLRSAAARRFGFPRSAPPVARARLFFSVVMRSGTRVLGARQKSGPGALWNLRLDPGRPVLRHYQRSARSASASVEVI